MTHNLYFPLFASFRFLSLIPSLLPSLAQYNTASLLLLPLDSFSPFSSLELPHFFLLEYSTTGMHCTFPSLFFCIPPTIYDIKGDGNRIYGTIR